MKRLCLFLLLLLATCTFFAPVKTVAQAETPMTIKAKSAYLMDKRTGETLYGMNENEKLPIASMVKIMTALLSFEEIDKGSLALDEKITISDSAAGMGGSQMFLERGLEYPVTDLLKGVIVVSANDACVALAERISGSEESFVAKMNDRAKSLGMHDTVFVNATGLPKEGGYSTAHDVALMLRELTKHDHYFDYSKIWLEEYTHPDGRITVLTNTNKFVRFYDECDGGKTGYTSQAKFCLAASATRGESKLISVIIGAEDSKTRFAESKKLLSYGFASYRTEIIVEKGDAIFLCPIAKGKKTEIPCYAEEDIAILRKVGEDDMDYSVTARFFDVKAPVEKGDVVGEVTLKIGEKSQTVRLIASEGVKRANIGDVYRKIAELW